MSTRESPVDLGSYMLDYLESLEGPVIFEEEEINGLRPGAKRAKVLSTEQIDKIRDELYEGSLIPWADNHVADPNSGVGLRVAYDPRRVPEQRLTEFVTPARLSKRLPKAVILKTPEPVFKAAIRGKLAKALGSEAVARAMVTDLENIPAFEGEVEGPSLIDHLRQRLDQGENSALVPAHANLRDPGFGLGVIAHNLGSPHYIYENLFADLNKLMTVEANLTTGRFGTKVKTLTDQLRPCANILWRIPNTGVRDRWGISTTAFVIINSGSQNVLNAALNDHDRGVLLATAPHSQRMDRITDPETGKLTGLAFPTKAMNPEEALDGINATIPFGFWINPEDMGEGRKEGDISWKFGSFVLRQVIEGQKESNKSYIDRVMLENKRIMEELTGLPVEYRPLARPASQQWPRIQPEDQ